MSSWKLGGSSGPRVLLVEANDMDAWVGAGMPYEVHIPPIGLMYLAAYAREAVNGVEIRIVESSLHCAGDEEYLRTVESFRPDVVGIRSINFFARELRRIASLTRASSDALIVAGGPIVRAMGCDLLRECPEIDVAVKGEGERTLASILAGHAIAGLPGVIHRSGEDVVEAPDAGEIPAIDELPFPAYDLVDLDHYATQLSYSYNHRRQGVLLTSRGCPYSCAFCFSHWKSVRLRSADNVYREMVDLHERFGIEDFYIIDDIFNVKAQRALDLFRSIGSDGLKVRLYFSNGLRADIVDEEFVDRAIEAGAIWFTYAVETGSEDLQRLIRKRVDLDKAAKIIGYTQERGVVVNISTMFGFPTETYEQARQTLDWLGRLPKPSVLPYHFCLRVFPKCEIVQQARDAGWDPQRIEAGSECSYNDLPIGTPTLSQSQMTSVLIEYHERFGLSNRNAVAEAVKTLMGVGYSETEIAHMYSVLKRRVVPDLRGLLQEGAA
ncbi:MAG: radical SAM protein [Acidobacteriota bacterium]